MKMPILIEGERIGVSRVAVKSHINALEDRHHEVTVINPLAQRAISILK
ncbi:MAG: hypothetical protein ACLUOI_38590 [Eisenbergiella sp.]